jgi:insertion element IS1 protein InsB
MSHLLLEKCPVISETKIAVCTKCQSTHLSRNGKTKAGKQKYVCKDCGAYGSVDPQQSPYTEQEKEQILRAYQERSSLRGVERVYGTVYRTVMRWLEKKVEGLPPPKDQLLPRAANDVLELDEVWSFVGSKENPSWLWTALCRQTRQIVGWVIRPSRDAFAAIDLRDSIDERYRSCPTVSDQLDSYEAVFSPTRHRSVGKETGETAHMERWNNTLRQRLGRFVRKTLSFSKSEARHELVVRWWMATYNLTILEAA